MKKNPVVTTVVNEVLIGAAMLSIVALHGFMLFLVARGAAEMDGFGPHVNSHLAA